jgi:dTMP kinase
MKRAPFIVIEGLDRSGKSTQATILRDRLVALGSPAILFKFPGEHSDTHISTYSASVQNYVDRSTPIGKMINEYLQSQSDLDDRAIHLLFSANRWELAYAVMTDIITDVLTHIFDYTLDHRSNGSLQVEQ